MSAEVQPRRDVTRVDNPFGSAPMVATPSTAGLVAASSKEVAEVQAQMQIARHNPRNQIQAMDRVLNAFTRPGLAEAGVYEYSRGGTQITGLSIRAAEALAQNWGNIRTGIKELTRQNGQSEVQSYAWDMETGFYEERTFHVRHWRDTKQGGYALKDERDIYELIANMGARRQRACILAVIPGDVKEAAERQIHTTMKANVEITPESIKKMVDYFAETFGVSQQMIEARIQRRIESIMPAQMLQLKRIAQSLKDGMGSVGDFFEVQAEAVDGQQAATQTESVKDKLRAKQQQQTAADPKPGADLAGTIPHYDKTAALQALKEAGSPADLEKAWTAIALDYTQTKREVEPDIDELYKARKKELAKR